MKIRNIIAVISLIALAGIAVKLLPAVYTSPDHTESDSIPSAYHITEQDVPITAQTAGRCAAYSCAYVLRYFGDEQVSGSDPSVQTDRESGFVPPSNVAKTLRKHGCEAKAYHGTTDTLKQRIAQGNPVIVFIRIPHDTHYAVVTGYDEDSFYLADPMTENANADEKMYNRVIGAGEFEELWKTGTLLDNNIYIAVTDK